MASKKLLIYADGHLNPRRGGIGAFDTSEGMSSNAKEALRSLSKAVDAANDNAVDFFVAPGDLFDSGTPTPEAVARAKEQFARLETAKVILIDGNHDQQGILRSHRTAIESYFADQPWCAGAFSEAGVHRIDDIAFAVMPWVRVSSHNMLGATNEAIQRILDEMSNDIRDGEVSMLAGHLTVAECAFDSGKRGSEVNMVTSTLEASVPVQVLDDGPWALSRLGHIHLRQQLSAKTGYTGSPYKVSFGEAGADKGVDLVTLREDNTAEVEFIKFDVREMMLVDLTAEKPSPFVAREGDIVRIRTGEDTLDKAESLATAYRQQGAVVQIHRLPAEMVAVKREATYSTEMAPLDAMNAYMEKKGVEESKRAAIRAAFADVTAACEHAH